MARALEDHWPGRWKASSSRATAIGVPCERIEIVEAAHPVPDEAGLARGDAHRRHGAGPDRRRSGHRLDLGRRLGAAGRARAGLTLDDKRLSSAALLRSGATIREMNCVRRHLSAIKGGRLGALCAPARVVALLMSDVPGDDPIDIASGPTVADPTTCADALAVLARYGIAVPPARRALLESGAARASNPAIRASPAARRCSSPRR